MPYNKDISNLAPFPTGALPTDDQIAAILQRARQDRAHTIVRGLRRLFGSGKRA